MSNLTNPQAYIDAQSSAILSPQGTQGIGGWIFDIPTGEQLDLNSDITEHYTESGSFVEDHIVLKPVQITLTGLKGELVFISAQSGLLGALSAMTSVLGTVPAYLGPLTPQATQKIAQLAAQAQYIAQQALNIEKRGENLVKFLSGDDNSQNLQQKAYAQLFGLWKSKQFLTVQTPWTYYDNMAIAAISFKQDDKSNDVSDISVTLKQMRIVDIQVTSFDAGAYRSAIDAQNKPTENNGQTQGSPVSTDSALYQAVAVPLLGAPR